MKIAKKLAAIGLAVALTASLAACGGGVSKNDATVYIQGELDSTYLGKYNEDYLKLMDMTAEEAEENNYMWNLEAEADIFMDAVSFDPTEETKAKVIELFKEIYAHSKYEVQPASKMENGSFAVEVLVEPIDILVQYTDNNSMSDIYYGLMEKYGVDFNTVGDMSDEDYNAMETEFVDTVIAGIRALIPSIGYEKQQSVIIQLKLEDNTYNLVSTDWQKLDDMIIDYGGNYAD